MGWGQELGQIIKKERTALLQGHIVWLECVKYPGSLDAGKHWYRLYYNMLTTEGRAVRREFYFPPFMQKDKNDNDDWTFRSGAIGMSRLIDATDNIFVLLRECGGCYAQF